MEYIVTSNIGKVFRVHEKNLHLIPKGKGWRVIKGRVPLYFNLKTGKINKKFCAVKEIKTSEDVQKVGASYENEFDLLFGRLSEIK